MRLKQCIICLACLTVWCVAQARYPISITRAVGIPDVIIQDDTEVAEYTVSNNLSRSTPIFRVTDLPSYLTQTSSVTTGTACPANIQLAAGGSCVLGLQYHPTAGALLNYKPKLCLNGVGGTCAIADKSLLTRVSTEGISAILEGEKKMYLIDNNTGRYRIHNTSNVAARSITVTLPDYLQSQIQSQSSNCATIAANSYCDVTVTLKSNTDLNHPEGSVLIKGSNTNALSAVVQVESDLIDIEPLTIAHVGTTQYQIFNRSNATVQISNAVYTAALGSGVTRGSLTGCASIAPQTSCLLPFTATTSAYGRGNLAVTYNPTGGSSKTVNTNLMVAKSSVSLVGAFVNDVDLSSSDRILLSGTNNGFVCVQLKNTGEFDWNISSVAVSGGVQSKIVSPLEQHDTKSCNDSSPTTINLCNNLSPGSSCYLKLTTQNITDTAKSKTGMLTLAGDNINTAHFNLAHDVGLRIFVSQKADDVHLSYRKLIVQNNLAQDMRIFSIAFHNVLSGKIAFCGKDHNAGAGNPGASDSNYCAFESTCAVGDTATLIASSGGTCTLWFKAQKTGSAPSSTAGGEVTVTAKNAAGSLIVTNIFDANVATDLYAGGKFNNNCNSSGMNEKLCYIARYDGQGWKGLAGVKLNDKLNALYSDGIDLYAGGDFSTDCQLPGKEWLCHVARWNGEGWIGLDNGLKDSVSAINATTNHLTKEEKLYIVGPFTHAQNTDDTLMTHAATWNPHWHDNPGLSSWTALPVNDDRILPKALSVSSTGSVYMGALPHQTTANAQSVLKLNPSTLKWEAAATNNTFVYNSSPGMVTGTAVDSTYLYAVGEFKTVAGLTDVGRIARLALNGSGGWQKLYSANAGAGVNGWIRSAMVSNNRLFVGGAFDSTMLESNTLTASTVAKRYRGLAYWDIAADAWKYLGCGLYVTNPNTDYLSVYTMTTLGTTAYFGGKFDYTQTITEGGENGTCDRVPDEGSFNNIMSINTGGLDANTPYEIGDSVSALSTGLNNAVLALETAPRFTEFVPQDA